MDNKCSGCLGSQTLAGITRDCEASVGGVQEIYIATYVPNAFTISSDAVSAVTSAATFYTYCPRKNSASLTSTLNVSDNGSKYFANEIAMYFTRMESAKRAEIMALTLGATMAIVKDKNGKYWAVGVTEPLEANGGTGETGAQKADNNQYSIVLANEEARLPYEISEAVMATVTIDD